MSYVRRERDWLARAEADGRPIPAGRLLPMLPAGASRGNGGTPNAGGGHSGHLHNR